MKTTPWMQSAYDLVLSEARANRLAHALLVQGDQGIGIELLAESILAFRLCSQPTDSACGQCKSCQLLAAGTHPDIKVLEPTGAGQVIKVDQIREVVGFLSQTPQIGDWKLLRVSDAHRMNLNAANALLKILEEPPGNSLIVLVADRPQLLLPTVRSRCRKLIVSAPSEQETAAYCLSNTVTDTQLSSLTPLLGQRPMMICEWAKEGHLARWELLQEGLEKFSQNKITTTALTDSLKDLGLADILEWLMKMAALRSKDVTPITNNVAWLSLYEKLAEAHQDVERGSNPNRQLLLDECFLRWKAAFEAGKSVQR